MTSSLAFAQPSAQPSDQPPAQPPAGPAVDDVILPLVSAAELAMAQSRPELALARAEVALSLLAPSSPLAVRASGVRLLANNALQGATPNAPDAQEVLEPLLAQATLDARQGALALATARIEIIVARGVEGSPLVVRARGLAAAIAAAQAQAQQPPPPPHPYYAPPPPLPVAPPYSRGVGELVELYITAVSFGIYTGIFVPYSMGLNQCMGLAAGAPIPSACPTRIGTGGQIEVDANALNAAFVFPALIGGGLFAAGVAALDAVGLRTGIGPSISVGLRYGTLSGFLLWGATGSTGMNDREHLGLAWAAGLTGGLLGAAIGFGGHPSTDHVRFVETGGIWGAGFGLLLGLTIAGWDNQFGKDDDEIIIGTTLGGVWTALLVNSILASTGSAVSAQRGWWMTLGFAIGAGAGTIVPALVAAASREFSPAIFGAVSAGTSVLGLVLAYLLTQGMASDSRAAAAPDVQFSFGPTDTGGALFSGYGRF